jgi:hypothetical protein
MSQAEDGPQLIVSSAAASLVAVQSHSNTEHIPGKIAVAAIVTLLTAIWGLGLAAVVSLVPLQ